LLLVRDVISSSSRKRRASCRVAVTVVAPSLEMLPRQLPCVSVW